MRRIATPEEFARVEELFDRLVDLESRAREELLEAEPDAIAAEVRRLLNADSSEDELTRVGSSIAETLGAVVAERETIGPYRVVRRIGEGGMGVVFEARQVEPIDRRVAIKLIRWGFESERVRARFQIEAQALAYMDHRNVARVYEVGATPEGQPYFVMEYIEGEPLTDYCDRRQLGLEARLRLMIQVCAGVQHAHHKGVVHRDLKPSNILVTENEGEARPKIIDFGVAKAEGVEPIETGPRLTRLDEAVGTLEYMSPEQSGPGDVDSRADVYGLGVVLYELLTGRLPLELPSGGTTVDFFLELRNRDPVVPSERWRATNEGDAPAKERAARARGSVPAALGRRLGGDLDGIVCKALEKERDDRYASPGELAADLERHLDDEPVMAVLPSTWTRLRKLVRRHRWAFGVATLVALSLTAAVIGTSVGLVRARRAEEVARIAERAAREAEARARSDAETADRVADFLTDVFRVADPRSGRGGATPVREVLDEAVVEIRRDLEGQPDVRSRLLVSLGSAYRSTGLYEEASELLREAVRVRQDLEGTAASLVMADARRELGAALWSLDRLEGAETELRAALAIQEKACSGECDEIAETSNSLGLLLRTRDQESARLFYRRALAIRERLHGADDENAFRIRANLGALLARMGEYEEAARELEIGLAAGERILGPSHPDLGVLLGNLGFVQRKLGHLPRALELQQRDLELTSEKLGDGHPAVGAAQTNLALILQQLGRYEEALVASDAALATLTAVLEPGHRLIHSARTHRAMTLVGLGRLDEANREVGRLLADVPTTDGARPVSGLILASNVARRSGAETRAVELAREAGAGGTPTPVDAEWALAHALAAQGLVEEAEQAGVRAEEASGSGASVAAARLRALLGDGAGALAAFEAAVAAGLAEWAPLEDPELSAMREEPGFAAVREVLISRLRASSGPS